MVSNCAWVFANAARPDVLSEKNVFADDPSVRGPDAIRISSAFEMKRDDPRNPLRFSR
jgi:hypothetical protein